MTPDLGPNQPLIDAPNGRQRLSTPALVLDLDAMEQNIQAMARHCQCTGQSLRPHGKSHKASALARRQVEAGAIGICCATIREAEAMMAARLPGVLITSPVTGAAKIERLTALLARGGEPMVVSDSPDNVDALAAAARGGARPLKVVVDFDVGLKRTGVADDEGLAALARRIDAAEGLEFAGVQAYAGHLQHVAGFETRAARMAEQARRVADAVARLCQLGLAPALVTGGGTGTHDIDHRTGVFTELQAGSYLVTDVDYNAVHLAEAAARPFAAALFVQSTVVSAVHDSHAVIDAGLKSFATDGPAPELAAGAPAGARYRFMGDEHGAVIYPEGSDARLAVGDVVSCLVPHCDPTVNLYDHYHCVRGDRLVEILPIDGRGNP